jgi:hypothetical protein
VTSTVAIAPPPERIRCTACSADTTAWMLAIAPTTMGWMLLEGFWFCEVHAPAAPWIVLLDRERNAHQVTLLTLEQAIDDLGHATSAEGDWLSKTSRMMCETMLGERDALRGKVREHAAEIEALTIARNTDRTEWIATYDTMRAEIEALRCGDLGAYFDGELSSERRDAFDRHLATCKTCAEGLLGLMQQSAIVSDVVERRDAVVAAAIAWVRAGGTLAALHAAVNAIEET